MRPLVWTLLIGLIAPFGPTTDNGCGTTMWTTCAVTNTGSQVDIAGSIRGGGADRAAESGEPDPGSPRQTDDEAQLPPGCLSPLCRPIYSVSALPQVSIEDLASFRPPAPALTTEPLGAALAGAPTNLIGTASSAVIPGSVLGYDVTVRFTPVAFHFDHGDGTAQTSSTGGASWSVLESADFTPTATSHVYRTRGTARVSLTVDYRAEIDFGGGWRAVPGMLTVVADPADLIVVEARTALVATTCFENPRGPAC